MDAMMIGMKTGNRTLAWTADVRDYARWEYGRDAEAWLLTAARKARARRRKRPGLRSRVAAWLRGPRSPRGIAVADGENRAR